MVLQWAAAHPHQWSWGRRQAFQGLAEPGPDSSVRRGHRFRSQPIILVPSGKKVVAAEMPDWLVPTQAS